MKRRPGPIWKGPVPGPKPSRSPRDRHKWLYGRPRDQLSRLQKWAVAGILSAAVLFAVGLTLIGLKPPPRQVRIVLTGTPGLRVKVFTDAGGRANVFVARLPTNFVFAAHDLDFTVKRLSGGGELALAVFMDGRQRSLVISTEPAGGAFVELHHGLFTDTYQSATFELSR